jgi:RHS repeat-associated protein
MRTSKDVLATGAPTNRDESYVYDGLYRLKKFNRGTLSGGTIPDASASFNHVWQLDGLGNWSVFQEDADGGANGFATQTRAHNKANEIDLDDSHSNAPGDAIAGTPNWVDPTYDAAGCLTKGPQPGAEGTALHFVYDGWARLAEVKADSGGSPGATVAQYRYNGIHWRIRKILTGSDTFDYYYGENWQVLEVRRTPNGGTTRRAEQLLWHATYMDAPIVRWRNADNSSNGSTEETKYFTYDANHNVTALTSTTGAVNERYAYEAYGKVTVFDANWNVLGASSFGVDLLFAGMRRDGETGLYQVRHRYYHVTLGRFLSRDPVLANRMLQMYLYALANPLMFTDPSGEWPRWLEKAVSKAKFVVNVVVNTVKEIPATFASGEAVDSLSGWVQGASGGLVKTTPPYGHQAAHAGGVGIGTETLKAAASSAVPGGWAAQGLYATGEALVEGKSWDEAILAGGEEALMSKLGGGG